MKQSQLTNFTGKITKGSAFKSDECLKWCNAFLLHTHFKKKSGVSFWIGALTLLGGEKNMFYNRNMNFL